MSDIDTTPRTPGRTPGPWDVQPSPQPETPHASAAAAPAAEQPVEKDQSLVWALASTALMEGWELVMSVEEQRLMEPMVQLRQTLAVLMVVTLAAVIAIIALFYRRSALRIRKLTEGAEAIAHGNLQWRLEDRGSDEISALSGAFNRMAERLDSLIDATVQSEKMVESSSAATRGATSFPVDVAEARNALAALQRTPRR